MSGGHLARTQIGTDLFCLQQDQHPLTMPSVSLNHNQCQNCNSVIPDEGRFCPVCGQSVMDIRQPWIPLLKQLLGEVFDWDGRMITTLKRLLLSPGRLTLEFVQGHRIRHTPPVRLYLAVSLLFFFIFPLIMPQNPAQGPAAPIGQATENYSRMMFLLLPVFALLVKLFHRKQFYMQHLIFSMHLFSAMFIVFAVMLSMENLADQSLAWVVAQVAVFSYMLWYLVMALKVAYEQTWMMATLKSAGLVALFLPTLSGALNLAVLI